MSSWILSIVGIVCMGVIIDIFIPDGQTNKYIKGIFSLLIVFVIISPLPKFINKDYNLNNILNNVNTDIDINFISNINKQKADAIQNLLTNALKNEKIDVKSLEITSNYLQEEFEVMSVFVDISNNKAETKEELKNNIIKIIQANININKEKIIFNEWNFKKNIKSIYSEKN